MTQPLAAFQSRLGRALRGEDTSPIDPSSRGFRFTATVRRSWCEGRTMIAARTVLTLVPDAERRRLVAEYVDRGGGLAMFRQTETEAFLAFLAARLPYPSHALTLCHMAQALNRARSGMTMGDGRPAQTSRDRIDHVAWTCLEQGVPSRVEPEVRAHIVRELRARVEREAWLCLERAARGRVARGQYAALVWFHGEPDAVLGALRGAPPPPVGEPAYPLLFAPGLPNLWRAATREEAALWASLPTDHAAPRLIERLVAERAVVYVDQ